MAVATTMGTTTTTIPLRRETKALLRRLRSKGQTYDQVLRDLIEKASIWGLDARWNRILAERFIPLRKL